MIRRYLPLVLALHLAAPAVAAPEGQQTLFSFIKPTDVVNVESQAASFPELTAEPTPEGEVLRRYTFNAADNPSLRLSPQSGDWDWSQAGAMSLRLQNAMDWAITLDVRIESRDGKQLTSRIALPAGPAQTLLMPLAATSPRAQGMRAAPPMPVTVDGQRVLLADTVEGELNLAQVSAVTLSMSKPDAAQSILLGRFGVQAGDAAQKAVYTGIIDAFGQYSRGQWPEKVSKEQQLREGAAAREAEQLKDLAGRAPAAGEVRRLAGRAEFRGQRFLPQRKARRPLVSGHSGGQSLYSLGVNAVSAWQSQTYVEGRESMFSALPKDGEPLAAYYGKRDSRSDSGASRGRAFDHGRWFDFYRANLQRSHAQPCPVAPTPLAHSGARRGRGLSAARVRCRALDPACPRPPAGLGFQQPGRLERRHPGRGQARCPTAFRCRSPGTTPPSAPAMTGGAACPTRSTRVSPWPPSAPSPSLPATAVTIPGCSASSLTTNWPGLPPALIRKHAMPWLTALCARLPMCRPKRAFLKQLRDKYRNQNGLSKAWGIELKAWELMEDPGFEAPLPSAEFRRSRRTCRASSSCSPRPTSRPSPTR